MSEARNRPRARARLSRAACACALLALLATAAGSALAQTSEAAPVLLVQPNSQRAIALDSVTFRGEPFNPAAALPWMSTDGRTRVLLFATNLEGAAAADLSVEAEDGTGRRHSLPVEFVGLVPDLAPQKVSQIAVRLVDALDNVGDVLIKVSRRGAASNGVLVGVGFVGGGRPGQAVSIAGRVTTGVGVGLEGAILRLSGAVSALTATDAAGNFSFPNLLPGGDYTVSVAKTNYSFDPPARSLAGLLRDARADFVASLAGFKIAGRITEGGQPVAGIKVNLAGAQTASATTDADGKYSFDARAEGNYLVTPEAQFYTFAPTSVAVNNLSADQALDFSAILIRPTYRISGFVRSGTAPVAGVAVALTGTQQASAITDAAGFYSFAGLHDGSYTLTVTKPHHTFAPPSATFAALGGDKRADFEAAVSVYRIAGQITENNGAPVPGLRVDLGGHLSAIATTDAQGNYSFTAHGGGNYVVSPVSGTRAFSPWNVVINNLSGDRTHNFVSNTVPGLDFNVFYVLEFDGSPQTVDFGDFFQTKPGRSQLGKFFWEFWAMPGTDALSRYMLSDGYGGAHALLFGFSNGSRPGRYTPYGNVWNGTTAVQFGGDDGPAPNEWGHYAVGWDGDYVYTYFNGVPVGLTPFAGPRLPPGQIHGAGDLFIGGSDHSNFMGRIAQVRGFEDANPRDAGLQTAAFRPDTVFGLTQGTGSGAEASFLASFLKPGLSIPDLAGGRVGVLRGSALTAPNPTQTYPLPQFVIDPNAPTTSGVRRPAPPAIGVDAPATPPPGAVVFDSFSRPNATYAFDGRGGLGRTEAGSAGVKAWQTAIVTGGTPFENEAFGLLNGNAVALADWPAGCVAWVEPGVNTGTQLIRSTRRPGLYKSGIDTGIAFRVVNSGNFFYAYTYGEPLDGRRRLTVGHWHELRRTDLVRDILMPESWSRLQVVTSAAGVIEVYADDTLVYSTSKTLLSNATGAGLWNNSHNHALTNRWDDFSIFAQP